MSAKRKDNKGRVLRTGQSQRTDLTYQYRYADITGKRRTVYANDLQEQRKKEKAIQKDVGDGINYCEGNVTVIELSERYIALKQGVRHATKVGYNFVLNLVKKEDFGFRKINTIKPSDAAITMNVYTHASYERAEEAMQKILQFKAPEVKRMTGCIYTIFTPFGGVNTQSCKCL